MEQTQSSWKKFQHKMRKQAWTLGTSDLSTGSNDLAPGCPIEFVESVADWFLVKRWNSMPAGLSLRRRSQTWSLSNRSDHWSDHQRQNWRLAQSPWSHWLLRRLRPLPIDHMNRWWSLVWSRQSKQHQGLSLIHIWRCRRRLRCRSRWSPYH